MELLEWWNLIFVLPFLGALFYLLLQASGLLGVEHAGGADADADVAADLGAGVDADLDAAHGVEHPHILYDHGGDDVSGIAKAFSFLGVGKVPLSFILMSFCFLWGFAGWASNEILQPVLRTPVLFVWISIAVALVASLSLTRLLVRGLVRITPATESYDVGPLELVGRVAKVIYPVTPRSGTARLRDDFGNLLDLACRVAPGEPEVPAGKSVVLLSYDPEKGIFHVQADPLDRMPDKAL